MFPTILNQSDFLVEVECRADGQPLPELSWLTADNRNISTNSSEVYTLLTPSLPVSSFLPSLPSSFPYLLPFLPLSVRPSLPPSQRIHNNNGILRIFDPVPEDSGQYICLAENTAGIKQASIALCIGEKDGSLGSASDPGNDTGSGLTSDGEYTHTHSDTHTHTCTHTHTHTHTHTQTHTHAHARTHTCMHTHARTCTNTHTHT